MSVMILTGLGGRERSATHVEHTARILNRMQPRLLSALRVIPVENTELFSDMEQGRFTPLTEEQAVCELRELIARLDLSGTVFRANHASNILPLEGRFPRDQPRLLDELDTLIRSDRLDTHSPGPVPLWL